MLTCFLIANIAEFQQEKWCKTLSNYYDYNVYNDTSYDELTNVDAALKLVKFFFAFR